MLQEIVNIKKAITHMLTSSHFKMGFHNSIKRFNGSLKDYFQGDYGRDKGYHLISRYCGNNFTYNDTVVINKEDI